MAQVQVNTTKRVIERVIHEEIEEKQYVLTLSLEEAQLIYKAISSVRTTYDCSIGQQARGIADILHNAGIKFPNWYWKDGFAGLVVDESTIPKR